MKEEEKRLQSLGITPAPDRLALPERLPVISEEEEEKRQGGSQIGSYREISPRVKALAKVKDMRRKSNAAPALKPFGVAMKPKSSGSDVNGPGNILSALAKSLGSKIKAMQQEPKIGGSRLGQHPKT